MDLFDPRMRIVRVGAKHFPESLLDAAINTVLAEKWEAALADAPTTRSAMRALRDLKNPSNVTPIMLEAMRRVLATGTPLTPAEVAASHVVASFGLV